jgi:hypothetical protein
MTSNKLLLLIFTCMICFSCKEDKLKHGIPASNRVPYIIRVTEPNDTNSFYYKLYDSLDLFISRINNKRLHDFWTSPGDSSQVISWLDKQVDGEFSGLGYKASYKEEKYRTTDEFYLQKGSQKDKVSFIADYHTESIPKEWLNPESQKANQQSKATAEEIALEREKFSHGGTLVRRIDGEIFDTLYAYPYTLDIDITLQYQVDSKGEIIRKKFTIPAQTVVFHRLRKEFLQMGDSLDNKMK